MRMDQAAAVGIRTSESFEFPHRAPDPRLAGLVLTYTGQDWTPVRPLTRRMMALVSVVLVIDFEAAERQVAVAGRPLTRLPTGSLVTGLSDRPMLIEQSGRTYGMTVQLTPPGARALLGMPLHELTNATFRLEDPMGAEARRLTERLAEAPGWPARFRLLDDFLLTRMTAGPDLASPLRRAWQRLTGLSGDVRIGALADEVGWSRQHLNARFRQEIGLSPKMVGRIARLQRTLSFATDAGHLSWADAAVACGFADQSHLNRDFRLLAGCTPAELSSLLAAWSGLLTGDPAVDRATAPPPRGRPRGGPAVERPPSPRAGSRAPGAARPRGARPVETAGVLYGDGAGPPAVGAGVRSRTGTTVWVTVRDGQDPRAFLAGLF
ncbi:helix-turn-helix domain-containing protein [Streptomyces caatingaensis]|uniref:helix-turn-helix domain-containing protein n=1 Tax=Streptomyces caatingaensis TaxID=1678637 RepID=UPI000A41DF31|nr:helix-turn-helix domain-containing protein [Streptomyces caatingaensis]